LRANEGFGISCDISRDSLHDVRQRQSLLIKYQSILLGRGLPWFHNKQSCGKACASTHHSPRWDLYAPRGHLALSTLSCVSLTQTSLVHYHFAFLVHTKQAALSHRLVGANRFLGIPSPKRARVAGRWDYYVSRSPLLAGVPTYRALVSLSGSMILAVGGDLQNPILESPYTHVAPA